MATSLEKIHGFKADLEGPPGPDADATELSLRSLVLIGAPMFEALLPDDPEIMDQALTLLAEKLLELRSDDAPALQIAPAAGLLEQTTPAVE
jgi:hypothetical protein